MLFADLSAIYDLLLLGAAGSCILILVKRRDADIP